MLWKVSFVFHVQGAYPQDLRSPCLSVPSLGWAPSDREVACCYLCRGFAKVVAMAAVPASLADSSVLLISWVLATRQRFSCELGDVIPNLMALSLSSQGNCCVDSGPNQNLYLFIRPFSRNFPWNSCFHKKLLGIRNVIWDRLKMPVSLHFGIIIWIFRFTCPLGQDSPYLKFFLFSLLDPFLISFARWDYSIIPCKSPHLGFQTFPTHRNKALISKGCPPFPLT